MIRKPTLASFSIAFLVSLLAGCTNGTDDEGGTCPGGTYSCNQRCEADAHPPACGQACDGSLPCPSGYYCGSDGACASDCVTSADAFCPRGLCTQAGECEAPPGHDDGHGEDAAVCARESLETTPATPNVVFLIDRSRSMQGELDLDSVNCPCNAEPNVPNDCYSFLCGMPELSRWDQLRDVLIGTGGSDTGLIGSLQSHVRFGVATYTDNGIGGCPDMSFAPSSAGSLVVATDNHAAIRAVYAGQGPGTYTPTGDAVDALMDELDDIGLLDAPDPTIVILATDGEPGRCENNLLVGSEAARNEAVTAIANAFSSNGVRTFVLAVAAESQLAQSHVNALANAGVGDGSGTALSAPSWRVNSVGELRAAIEGIIEDQLSCTVELDGMVTDLDAGCAEGDVAFVDSMGARTPIPCDPANGWTLTDADTMELHGDACDTLRDDPAITLEARFPCDVVVPG